MKKYLGLLITILIAFTGISVKAEEHTYIIEGSGIASSDIGKAHTVYSIDSDDILTGTILKVSQNVFSPEDTFALKKMIKSQGGVMSSSLSTALRTYIVGHLGVAMSGNDKWNEIYTEIAKYWDGELGTLSGEASKYATISAKNIYTIGKNAAANYSDNNVPSFRGIYYSTHTSAGCSASSKVGDGFVFPNTRQAYIKVSFSYKNFTYNVPDEKDGSIVYNGAGGTGVSVGTPTAVVDGASIGTISSGYNFIENGKSSDGSVSLCFPVLITAAVGADGTAEGSFYPNISYSDPNILGSLAFGTGNAEITSTIEYCNSPECYEETATCKEEHKVGDKCVKTISNVGDKEYIDCTYGESECYECLAGYELINQKCVKTTEKCPYGEKCYECLESAGYSLSGTKCSKSDVSTEQCSLEDCATCSEGYKKVGNKCVLSDSDSEECSLGELKCSKCKSGYTYLNGRCVSSNETPERCELGDEICSECKSGYSLKNGVCVPDGTCNPDDYKTSCPLGESECSECDASRGYKNLYNDGKCYKINYRFGDSEATQCKSTYSWNSNTEKCVLQANSKITCPLSDKNCAVCKDGFKQEADGSCTKLNPTYSVPFGNELGTRCKSGYTLKNKTCILNSGNNSCESLVNCNFGEANCTKCKSGYTQSGNYCIENTPTEESCDFGNKDCTECKTESGYTLNGNSCIKNIPKESYCSLGETKCTVCPSGFILSNGRCEKQNSTPSYCNLGDANCSKCIGDYPYRESDGCYPSGDSKSPKCKADHLINGKCQKQVLVPTEPDTLCDEGDKNCYDINTTCKEGKFVLGKGCEKGTEGSKFEARFILYTEEGNSNPDDYMVRMKYGFCNPSYSIPSTCSDGSTEFVYEEIGNGEGEDSDNKNNIVKCVLNNPDLEYKVSDEENPFCRIYCKENLSYKMPGGFEVTSGGYVSNGALAITSLNDQVDCYTRIDKGAFDDKVDDLLKSYENVYNEYKAYEKMLKDVQGSSLNNVDDISSYSSSTKITITDAPQCLCNYSEDELNWECILETNPKDKDKVEYSYMYYYTRYNVSDSKIAKKLSSRTNSYSLDPKVTLKVPSGKTKDSVVRSMISCDSAESILNDQHVPSDLGQRYRTEGEITEAVWKANLTSSYSDSITNLESAIERIIQDDMNVFNDYSSDSIEKLIDQYNACVEWEINEKLDISATYTYQSTKSSSDSCTGGYSSSGSKSERYIKGNIENDFTGGTDASKDSKTDYKVATYKIENNQITKEEKTVKITDINYVHKSAVFASSASISPNCKKYSIHPSGELASSCNGKSCDLIKGLVFGNDLEYGSHEYSISLSNIGTVAKDRISELTPTTTGSVIAGGSSYMCAYNVTCDHCPIVRKCTSNCPITCVGCDNDDPIIYNLDYRVISLANINPNNREMGYNWKINGYQTKLSAAKAYATIEEIEASAGNTDEDVEKENYSLKVDMTPKMIKEIRKYNADQKASGGYANDTLKCYDYNNEHTNIMCYSTYLDTLMANYPDSFDAQNRPEEGNRESLSWNTYTLPTALGGKVAASTDKNGYWIIMIGTSVTANAGPSWK